MPKLQVMNRLKIPTLLQFGSCAFIDELLHSHCSFIICKCCYRLTIVAFCASFS